MINNFTKRITSIFYTSSTLINIVCLIIFTVLITFSYVALSPETFINQWWSQDVEHVDNWLYDNTPYYTSIIETVDSLVTTSTFAFVAISSISPSSSGSTVVINRLSWKGLYIFRYPLMLVMTTLVSVGNVIALLFGLNSMMLFGIGISFLILINVVLKYTFFHRRSNISSARMFNSILKTYKRKNMSKVGYDKILWRMYLNPLKGSSNLDLIKSLILCPESISILIWKYNNENAEKSEWLANEKQTDTKTDNKFKNYDKIAAHLFFAISENKWIEQKAKLGIIGDVFIKALGSKNEKTVIKASELNKMTKWFIGKFDCKEDKTYAKLIEEVQEIYIFHSRMENIIPE